MNLSILDKRIPPRHLIAVVILIKACGVAFATLVFSRFTPLVDSELYLSGFYDGTREFRTGLVQWLAILLNHLGGAYMAHFAFSMISVLGLVYYFLTGGRRWPLLLTLLLPSTLVWSSIVGKEAIFCGGLGLALVVWSSYTVRSLRWHEVFIAAISLGVCFSFRPHYAVALSWLFVSTFSIKHLKDKAPIFLLSLLFLGVVSAYFLVWDELLFRGYSSIESTARASRFETFGITANAEKIHTGFQQFKSYVPRGVLIGILGPLPSEVLKRPEFLPFLIEGVIILLSPIFIYLWAIKHALPQEAIFKRVFWWCLIPAILMLMVIHAPFGLLNPGSATRWRTNFEQIFYLAPLLLLYRFIDNDPA